MSARVVIDACLQGNLDHNLVLMWHIVGKVDSGLLKFLPVVILQGIYL